LVSDRPLGFLFALALASTSGACVLDWASLRSDGKTAPGADASDVGDANDSDGTSDDASADAAAADAKGSCEDTVVINEVQVAGSAGSSDEFVELHNTQSCDLRLEGFTLRYSSSAGGTPLAQWTGGASDAIGPGAYAVLGGSTYAGGVVLGRFTPGLAAAGGGVGLFNAGGKVIDSVAYGTINAAHPLVRPAGGKAAPAPPTGQSIARIPDSNNTGKNETDFVIATTPTPGAKN
jgi:hypothetical protein